MYSAEFTIHTASSKYARKLTRDQVNSFPIRAWDGEVTVARDPETAEAAFAKFADAEVVGFDTETRPAFRKGQFFLPSLLQLATEESACVIQLDQIRDDALVCDFLARPFPLKVGVSLQDDVADLRRRQNFDPAGFLDLGDVARSAGLQTHGLRNLAANLLGFRISKSAQTSNWAAKQLTDKQIRYAATDAWVGFLLFRRMVETGVLVKTS